MRALALLLMVGATGTAHAWEPFDDCGGSLYTHWEDLPSEWRIRDKLSGSNNYYSALTDTQVFNAIQGGWTVWSNPSTCNSAWSSVYGGTTTTPFDANSALSIVEFEESNWDEQDWGDVDGTIAVTFVAYFTSGAEACIFDDADQVYNGVGFDFTVTNSPQPWQTDLQSITAHENGHWLGLGHSNVANTTMYFAYAGGIGDRVLHNDDETGVCVLYPGTGTSDCDVNGTLQCNGTVNGNTSGAGSDVLNYLCAGMGWSYTGPERVYTLQATSDGQIDIDLTGLSGDLDLIVTSGSGSSCNPNNCLGASVESGNTSESLSFTASAGTTYYVVVDGYDGATSSFTLGADCPFETNCYNNQDDDDDGLIDCDDPDCDDVVPDSDGDGVCDPDDQCEGNDATGDFDDDGVCNNLDQCDGDDDSGDSDDDGICDDSDACEGRNNSGDDDDDGFCAEAVGGATLDCDDDDPDTFPGADEVCDGADNDCNDEIDDGLSDCDDGGNGNGSEEGGLACGCAVPAGAPAWPALLGLALFVRRRRSA